MPEPVLPRDFLDRFWQKESLLLSAALPDQVGIVDGDELAGLACEEVVESRIVTHDPENEDWHCEHGPFGADYFAGLPQKNWTLLVQAVDQWIPDLAVLLEHFDLFPRWRLDDVMVSYAADGGNVGPHFDYYDVFLLQTSGTRRWQLGQRCDEGSPLRDHREMKLLRDFDVTDEHVLKPGDMLYVPSGLAHWGSAVGDDCITVSIGFRAPAQRDILRAAVDKITAGLGEDALYHDGKGAFESDRWCINDAVVDSLQPAWEAVLGGSAAPMEALAISLGELVTEPRYPDMVLPPNNLDEPGILDSLERARTLAVCHHPASRFAYRPHPDGNNAELFVDGQGYRTTLAIARGVCRGEIASAALASQGERELLVGLLRLGSLYIEADPG